VILRLAGEEVEALRRDAEKNYPEESCALLFGKVEGDVVGVSWVVITENILHSEVRFQIDPQTVYKALKEAEEKGLDLVGFAHSHAYGSNPSLIDREFIKLWGDAVWLILSTSSGEVKAFQMVGDELKEVTVEIT